MKQNRTYQIPTRKKLNYEVGYYRFGEVAEWLNAAVLKTVERCPRSEGSNPSLSAIFLADLNLTFYLQNLHSIPRYF